MAEVLGIVLAAAVGALSGILTTAWKSRKDLEAQYDIDLRNRRIEAYGKLWKELQVLADYSPPGRLTPASAKNLSERLRRWYYEEGGFFLSEKTRAPYFNLQVALTELAEKSRTPGYEALDDETAKILRGLSSRLRTSTTRDVSTRIGPRLGPSIVSRIGRRWHRRAPLRITVDRRWDWDEQGAHTCYYVLLENRTDREVEVAHLSLGGAGPTKGDRLPLRVQVGELLEVAVMPKEAERGEQTTPALQVRLTKGNRPGAQVPPDVPIPMKVLVLPTRNVDRPRKRPGEPSEPDGSELDGSEPND